MNIDPLKQKLTEIDAATLRDFILDLYLHHPELSDKTEALLLYNDPAALAKALGKRIQSLRRGRRFIDYRASFEFSRELDALLADIESGLLTTSPKQAFEVVDRFLATAESVLNRVDDSGGANQGVQTPAGASRIPAAIAVGAWTKTKLLGTAEVLIS